MSDIRDWSAWDLFWNAFWRLCVLTVVACSAADLLGQQVAPVFSVMKLITAFCPIGFAVAVSIHRKLKPASDQGEKPL